MLKSETLKLIHLGDKYGVIFTETEYKLIKDMRIKFQLPNQKEKDEFHKLATKF